MGLGTNNSGLMWGWAPSNSDRFRTTLSSLGRVRPNLGPNIRLFSATGVDKFGVGVGQSWLGLDLL